MTNLQRIDHVQELSVSEDKADVRLRILKDPAFTNAPLYDSIFFDYMKRGARRLWLEFSSVEFVDSAGVGMLVKLHKSLTATGGFLLVVNPGRTVQNIFRIVALSDLIVREERAPPAPDGSPGPGAGAVKEGGEGVSRMVRSSIASPSTTTPGVKRLTLNVLENITNLNAAILRDGLLGYLNEGKTAVRLDMRKVDHIDSTGLGMLVRVAKIYQGSAASLTLHAAGEKLKHIIADAKLDRVLPIDD